MNTASSVGCHQPPHRHTLCPKDAIPRPNRHPRHQLRVSLRPSLTVLQASLCPCCRCKRLQAPDFPPHFRSHSAPFCLLRQWHLQDHKPLEDWNSEITEPGVSYLPPTHSNPSFKIPCSNPRYQHCHRHPLTDLKPLLQTSSHQILQTTILLPRTQGPCVAMWLVPGYPAQMGPLPPHPSIAPT